MKRGFTLMEILAVVLVVAVVASFAVPAFRSVRAEVRHQQAKSAGIKVAEAVRKFYRDSKGYLISGSITGTSLSPSGSCDTLSGVPPSSSGNTVGISQLFVCGYLVEKDFRGLPYTFTPNSDLDDLFGEDEGALVTVTGTSDAGKKYKSHSMLVYRDGTVWDADTEVSNN